MTCEEFDRWLDDGSPATFESAAPEHARTCTRCAAALSAGRAIESALAAFALAAPPEFTERVMARLARAPRRAVARALPPAMDWWVHAAADPATALALVLAGLMTWRGEAIVRTTKALAQGVLSNAPSWLDRLPLGAPPALPRFATPLANPAIALALTLAAAPAVLWASWQLFAWAERACVPARRWMPRG